MPTLVAWSWPTNLRDESVARQGDYGVMSLSECSGDVEELLWFSGHETASEEMHDEWFVACCLGFRSNQLHGPVSPIIHRISVSMDSLEAGFLIS